MDPIRVMTYPSVVGRVKDLLASLQLNPVGLDKSPVEVPRRREEATLGRPAQRSNERGSAPC